MTTPIILTLTGVIISLVMLLFAAGRLVWILSDKLTRIEADVILIKEVNSIKLTHLERELAENKREVNELKMVLDSITKLLYSIKKQNTKET